MLLPLLLSGWCLICFKPAMYFVELFLYCLFRRFAAFYFTEDQLKASFEKSEHSGNGFIVISFWHFLIFLFWPDIGQLIFYEYIIPIIKQNVKEPYKLIY